MSGEWRFSAKCPPQSQYGEIEIVGVAIAEEVSVGQYQGTLTNNLGQAGTFLSRIEDDNLRSEITWEGSGPTQALLIYNRETNTFEGIDTNGCAVTMTRPNV
jgi:hypothetical protein